MKKPVTTLGVIGFLQFLQVMTIYSEKIPERRDDFRINSPGEESD